MNAHRRRLGGTIALALVLSEPAVADTAETRAIASGFLRTFFVEHDLDRAFQDFVSPDLIQHNPEIGDGRQGDAAFFARRQALHPDQYPPVDRWVNVVDRVMVDGDLFAMQHHVFVRPDDPGRVFVDVWRVAGGRIVEHWDVIQPVPAAPRNAATMWCGKASDYASGAGLGDTLAAPTCGAPDPAALRDQSLATVAAYTGLAFGEGRPGQAVDRYVAPDFVQHSPQIPPGKSALATYLTAQYAAPTRGRSVTVRTLAEGDLVLVHRHAFSKADPLGKVAVDIFRIRNGQVAEHWDVSQPVPRTTTSGHPMW